VGNKVEQKLSRRKQPEVKGDAAQMEADMRRDVWVPVGKRKVSQGKGFL